MAGYSANEATLAYSKQATKGTPAASVQYVSKFTGGDLDFDRMFARFDETSGTRDVGASYVQQVNVKGQPSIYARPTDIVSLLEAALGTRVTSGAGPFVHTITPSDTQLPYMTFWQGLGGAVASAPVLSNQFQDCLVDSLKLTGGVGQPLEVALGIMGLKGQRITAAYPGAPTAETPFLYPQVTLSKGGSAVTSCNSFEVNIDNGSALQQGNGSIFAYDIAPGERKVAGSLAILWETVADYAKFHTGTAGGTAPASTPLVEALTITVTIDANTNMVITLPNVVYTSYKVLPDKGGAPIVANITWEAEPVSTPIVTFAVKNAAAGTAYNGV
jgi:hypothetical protein